MKTTIIVIGIICMALIAIVSGERKMRRIDSMKE